MKWQVLLLVLLSAHVCRAQADGGGRDVSVALFSAQPTRSVVIAAAGPGAWSALCSTCRRQPLTTVLHMPAVREIVAGGPLTVGDEEHGVARTATGQWHLRVATRGSIDVVLTLPSERYVAAVLMGETLPGEPRESLRAMAVVARTFVLRLPAAKTVAGALQSDVCDSTACQALRLGPVSNPVNEAVRTTAGETLWFGSQRALVFFSGSCGGMTESASALWPKFTGVPYLRSITDPYCVRKDRAGWHGELDVASVQSMAKAEGWHLPARIVSAKVKERTSSQRVRTLAFSGENGEHSVVSGPALRLAVGRSLGWNILRSDAYDVRIRDGVLAFDGHGYGHGIGLCQQGALQMALAGKSYRQILGFYFANTTVRITRSDEGWKESLKNGVIFTGTIPLTPAQIQEAAEAWVQAKSRFPVRQQITPSIIFAPTTEVFRQKTMQPGWQIASTSGSTIVLQPGNVLAANHVSLRSTLQHEMLHVAVEAGANAKAPLWLREGLVEVLANEGGYGAPSLSAFDTERLLTSAGNGQESRKAHLAAAARTRLLADRYGVSTVRGWLIAGSPVPID